MSLCIYFFTLTALLTHIAFGSSIHLQREDVSIIPVYNGVSFDLWVDQTHYHALLHPWNDLLHSSHNIDTLGESVSRNTSFNTYRGDTIEYHITATLLTDGLVSAMIIPRNKGTGFGILQLSPSRGSLEGPMLLTVTQNDHSSEEGRKLLSLYPDSSFLWDDCFDIDDTVRLSLPIGIAMDKGFYDKSSLFDADNPLALLHSVFAKMNLVYESQIGLTLTIGATVIETELSETPWNTGCVYSIDNKFYAFGDYMKSNLAGSKMGAWHLLTTCYESGTVGIAYKGAACYDHSTGLASGVTSFATDNSWLTLAHELGHSLGADHSFEEGKGSTGGIMDYGDKTLDGYYQFNTKYRYSDICNTIKAVLSSTKWYTIEECFTYKTFGDTDAPTANTPEEIPPTVSPTRAPTPFPTPIPTNAPSPGYEYTSTLVITGEGPHNFEGINISTTSGPCILVDSASTVVIKYSNIGPCGTNGIEIRSSISVTMAQNYIHDAATLVYATTSSYLIVHQNTLLNAIGSAPLGQCVQIDQAGYPVRVSRNWCENANSDGIAVYDSYGISVNPIRVQFNHIINGGSGCGIVAGGNGGKYQSVLSNSLVNTGSCGIGITSGTYTTVQGNYVLGEKSPASDVGIYVDNRYDTLCSQNTVEDNTVNWRDSQGELNNLHNTGACGSVAFWNTNTYDGELTAETIVIQENVGAPASVVATASPATGSPTSAPTTRSPTTSPPTTPVPTTAPPTTLAPTTSSPTTSPPTTPVPTTAPPTTLAPTTSSPTTSFPTSLAPTTAPPTTMAPTTSSPTVDPNHYRSTIILTGPGPHDVTGIRVSTTDGPCILVKDASKVVIDSSTIGPCGGSGVEITGSTDVKVTGNTIAEAITHVGIDASSFIIVHQNTLINAVGSSGEGQCVRITDSQYPIRVSRNWCEGASAAAITVDNTRGISINPIMIQFNYIARSIGCGIVLGGNGNKHHRALKNTIVNTGECGVFVSGGWGMIVQENFIFGEARVDSTFGISVNNQYAEDCHTSTVYKNVINWKHADGTLGNLYDSGNCGPIDLWDTNQYDSSMTAASITMPDAVGSTVMESYIDADVLLEEAFALSPSYSFHWKIVSGFGLCSAECGVSGIRFRDVICASMETGAVVSFEYCDSNLMPPSSQPCNRVACADNDCECSEWTISEECHNSWRTMARNCTSPTNSCEVNGLLESEMQFCESATAPGVCVTMSINSNSDLITRADLATSESLLQYLALADLNSSSIGESISDDLGIDAELTSFRAHLQANLLPIWTGMDPRIQFNVTHFGIEGDQLTFGFSGYHIQAFASSLDGIEFGGEPISNDEIRESLNGFEFLPFQTCSQMTSVDESSGNSKFVESLVIMASLASACTIAGALLVLRKKRRLTSL